MYIERDKLLRQLEIVPLDGRYIDIEAVEGLVRDMPAADVVEVVRCKDCDKVRKIESEIAELFCYFINSYVMPDAYCSYGERRDGDGKDDRY